MWDLNGVSCQLVTICYANQCTPTTRPRQDPILKPFPRPIMIDGLGCFRGRQCPDGTI